jgi:hypothetical protein
MTYTSGNKLSYDDSSATVLTDGMVMVTSGLGYGQQMKLVDWLILAEGREKLVSKPVQAQEAPKTYAVGTKFRWQLNPETYRVAIQTPKGVLQVKSVTNGGGQVHPDSCNCDYCPNPSYPPAYRRPRPLLKENFSDFEAWRASLPNATDSQITTTFEDRPMIERRADIPETFTDIEKLKRLEQNFKIRSTFWIGESYYEKKERLLREMRAMSAYQAERGATASMEELSGMNRSFNRARRAYRRAVLEAEGMTEMQAKAKHYGYLQRGRSYIMANCGPSAYRITSCNGLICRSDGRLFSNFKEMGADSITVRYRCKTITV